MNMHHIYSSVTILLLGIAVTANAEPRSGGNIGSDFIMGASDKPGWSCGLFYESRERSVTLGRDQTPADLQTDVAAAYVGYNVFAPLTIYAIAGRFLYETDPGPFGSSDRSYLFGAAATLDIFAHEIQDPMLMENEIRLSATVAYYLSEAEAYGQDLAYHELKASLTASLVNHVAGSKLFLPESIAIFAGPAYSETMNDDIDDSPDEQIGFTGGLEVYQTKRVSYYARLDDFDKTGYAVGVNVRF